MLWRPTASMSNPGSLWSQSSGSSSPPLFVKWTCLAGAGAYKWNGEPKTACNAAPGATVSPAVADSDGPETGSALRHHRARRPARPGHQVYLQVTGWSVNTFMYLLDIIHVSLSEWQRCNIAEGKSAAPCYSVVVASVQVVHLITNWRGLYDKRINHAAGCLRQNFRWTSN